MVWQVGFSGRAVGLPSARRQFTLHNAGALDVDVDLGLYPAELNIHDVFSASVAPVLGKPQWAVDEERAEAAREQAARSAAREKGAAATAGDLLRQQRAARATLADAEASDEDKEAAHASLAAAVAQHKRALGSLLGDMEARRRALQAELQVSDLPL